MTNVLDGIRDFALPNQRLFPCDSAPLTHASARAFDTQAAKLPPTEKLAAARHIAKRAEEQNVAVHDTLVARISGTDLSPMFKVALHTRKAAAAWHSQAIRDLKEIEKLSGLIMKQAADVRPALLERLVMSIETFDKKYDIDNKWREDGIPDAVDTVFAKSAEEQGVVRVGSREIRARDFDRLDKTAAAKALTPETMKVAENFSTFSTATWSDQTSIAAFIPVR